MRWLSACLWAANAVMSIDFWRVSGAELANPHPGGVPAAALWLIRALNLVFNGLNALWFSKMLRGAIKVRTGRVGGCRDRGLKLREALGFEGPQQLASHARALKAFGQHRSWWNRSAPFQSRMLEQKVSSLIGSKRIFLRPA